MQETEFQAKDDAIACFCFRLTTGQLKKAYEETGSLKGVEEKTKAGIACTGCKFILQSLFGEIPTDQYQLDKRATMATSCRKPGYRVMKGFVIANGDLESTIVSSNAVAPQLGHCDATTKVEYMLVDHRGVPVIHRNTEVKTDETFIFDTRNEDLPRPFFGMFIYSMDRANLGASRFNVYWGNKNGRTSTHENASTGRPRVSLPIIVDKPFMDGPNTIYTALMNPHEQCVKFAVSVIDVDTQEEIQWTSELPPFSSMWVDANETLFKPAVKQRPEGRFAFRLISNLEDMHHAVSVYFFVHNRNTDLWTVNHL